MTSLLRISDTSAHRHFHFGCSKLGAITLGMQGLNRTGALLPVSLLSYLDIHLQENMRDNSWFAQIKDRF
jgi:hypothetical protein